jgi:hypothetical protein
VIFSQDTVSYLARMDMMSGEVRFLIAWWFFLFVGFLF